MSKEEGFYQPDKHLKKRKKLITTQFHNILRLFDALPNIPFTTSETIITYKHGIHQLP